MFEGKRTSSAGVRVYFNVLVRKSEYLCSLSNEAKQQYESKVVGTGMDLVWIPIPITDNWTRDPETIPQLTWSDVMLYMVSTPSPYTKAAVKIYFSGAVRTMKLL